MLASLAGMLLASLQMGDGRYSVLPSATHRRRRCVRVFVLVNVPENHIFSPPSLVFRYGLPPPRRRYTTLLAKKKCEKKKRKRKIQIREE